MSSNKAPRKSVARSRKEAENVMTDIEPTTLLSQVQIITFDNSRPFSLEGRDILAKVMAIPDSNTIVLGFYLFRNRWTARCRHACFTCPDMHSSTPEIRADGVKSHEMISNLLMDQVIRASFGPNDKFGRALVDITLGDERKLAHIMISSGFAAALPIA